MSRLSYGSFEAVLRTHITPKITKLGLAEILLTSPVVDARKTNKKTLRKSYNIDSSTVTRICSGERSVPPELRKCHMKSDALEYVKLCFYVDIVPRIQDSEKGALLKDILNIIEQDTELSSETKSYFERYANDEGLCDFLAVVYMYAAKRLAPTKSAENHINNLPRQNRFFCGREGQLSEIMERFRSGVCVQGLSGMGGVGKTQLALQYAHVHLTEYTVAWWINAETRLALQNSISAFLAAQKLLPKGADVAGIRQAFLDYLSCESGWLLIYDNAEYGTSGEYDTLKDFFPPNTVNGHILLTTRCRNAFENAVQMEIPVFGMEAALKLLLCRSGCVENPDAAKLAERLGFLPLALEYAAAYIRETPGVDYAAYSKKIDQYSMKVLDRKIGQLDYKMTVRETFHVTLDKLLEDSSTNPLSKSVAQFLNICAYLAPDDINIGLLAAYGTCLPEPVRSVLWDELDRDELVRDLTRYSLVRVDCNSMSMHRLLQEVLRDELDSDTEMICINLAYGIFYSAFYSLRTASMEKIREVLTSSVPHVQAVLSRYVQRYKQGNQTIPDKIMVAKEFFSWTALLLADTKHLEGDELLAACERDIPALQAAVDFYDLMACDKTIYHAYTLMLLAQANMQSGNTLTAFEQYTCALKVLDEVIINLPANQPLDHLQKLYRTETFQLASDICAAVASNDILQVYPDLVWQNHRSLVAVVLKQMECCTSRDDAGSYMEMLLTLRVFSEQVANLTHRAFVLRIDAPRWVRSKSDPSSDSVFGFFLPTEDVKPDLPAEITDGFDILLDSDEKDKGHVRLNCSWNTLAFAENVRTAEDMLRALLGAESAELSPYGKCSLYGVIYALAKQLKCDDVAEQYRRRFRELTG